MVVDDVSVVSLNSKLAAALSHNAWFKREFRLLTVLHLPLPAVKYPYAPTSVFRHDPPPKLVKQIKPVDVVHSLLPQVQASSFAFEPSVKEHAAPCTVDIVAAKQSDISRLPVGAAGKLSHDVEQDNIPSSSLGWFLNPLFVVVAGGWEKNPKKNPNQASTATSTD